MKRILCVVLMLAGCEVSLTSTPVAAAQMDVTEISIEGYQMKCQRRMIHGVGCIVCIGNGKSGLSCDWQHAPEAK